MVVWLGLECRAKLVCLSALVFLYTPFITIPNLTVCHMNMVIKGEQKKQGRSNKQTLLSTPNPTRPPLKPVWSTNDVPLTNVSQWTQNELRMSKIHFSIKGSPWKLRTCTSFFLIVHWHIISKPYMLQWWSRWVWSAEQSLFVWAASFF